MLLSKIGTDDSNFINRIHHIQAKEVNLMLIHPSYSSQKISLTTHSFQISTKRSPCFLIGYSANKYFKKGSHISNLTHYLSSPKSKVRNRQRNNYHHTYWKWESAYISSYPEPSLDKEWRFWCSGLNMTRILLCILCLFKLYIIELGAHTSCIFIFKVNFLSKGCLFIPELSRNRFTLCP